MARFKTRRGGLASPSDDPRDDAELLASSVRSPELFAIVYRRRAEEILGFFYRRTGDVYVSADLTAETFAIAFRRRAKFKPGPSPGQTWLYGIGKIELARYRRRNEVELRAVRKLGLEVPTLTETDIERIESIVQAEQICGDASEALAELPPGERAAVAARVLEDRDYADLADELGITAGAARVRVHRGLGRLAEALAS